MKFSVWLKYVFWYRIKKPFKIIGAVLTRYLTIYRIAFILIIIACVLYFGFRVGFSELVPNLIAELLSVTLTIVIIDTIYQYRSDMELKRILKKQLGSQNNAVASQALEELTARGWLLDGSLKRVFLVEANLENNSFSGANLQRAIMDSAKLKNTTWFDADLEGAFMDHADLRNATLSMQMPDLSITEAKLKGVTLSFAKLQGAEISNSQFVQLRSLWKAIMPNGNRYDGRFKLSDDIELHNKSAKDIADPIEWAFFYGVSLKQYLSGQKWANDNIELFRQ